MVGAADSVLIREVSLFGVSSLEIALYPVPISILTFVQGEVGPGDIGESKLLTYATSPFT